MGDPCQRLSRSMAQDKVEVSYENLFNIHPGHTIHVDFFERDGKDYLIIADKLTGYIKCDATTNKTTEAAVECIRKWGNLYGMPFKCVADGGPGFRDDFKTQLTQLKIRVVPSSCYNSQSNSLAERAVQSVKNCLKKSAERFTKLHLMEMVFAINTTESSEGKGSPAMRFFGRALRTNLPNSIGPEIDSKELIRKRIQKHDARIKKKSFKNKILYEVGDRVRLQNIKDKSWGLIGTVERRRTADDGQILSYDILTDKGYLTSRHRRYMKYLNDDNDKSDKNDNIGANTSEEIHSDEIPDKVVKRRSSRLKGAAASKVGAFVKSVSMGCEISSQKPIEAEVKLVITGRQVEVTKLVTTSEG